MGDDKSMKKRFVVEYDYGQGAVWAYLYAWAKSQIEREFPELRVHELPSERMREYASSLTLDIDKKDEGFLASLIKQRQRPR
jgi:hypothetical protein